MTDTPIRRTVLVAGGAGFIGSTLCETLLRRGDRVICVDDFHTGTMANVVPLCTFRDFRLVRHDVTRPLDLGERIDQIFNLASPASPPHYQADPVRTMLTNVVGTANLLALATAQQARFVQASTSEVYGDPEVHPQREDYVGHVNCTGPRACYDEGKRAAESLCHDYIRAGLDVRVARIFNTYGPRMRADDGRIVSNMVVQALEGQPMTVHGTGGQTRSFCYVTDLVAGLIALMDVAQTPDGPVNLGNPEEFTILELAETVRDLIGSRSEIVFRPLPQDDPQRRRPDIGRAAQLLGWHPTLALAEGLPPTVDWFAASLGTVVSAPRAKVAS